MRLASDSAARRARQPEVLFNLDTCQKSALSPKAAGCGRLTAQVLALACVGRTDANDPSVRTGRASHAESDDLEVIGLALLYPALERNVALLAIMDIRARPISFSERP